MVSPVDEHHQLHEVVPPFTRQRSSDDDGTIVGDDAARADMAGRPRSNTHLTADYNLEGHDRSGSATSPSRVREEAHRLGDDLELLKVERQVSRENESFGPESTQSGTVRRSRSRREEPVDEFDVATNPLHERTAVYKPPEHPNTSLSKLFKKIHNSSFLVRYFTYIVPVVLILLIPLLLGVFVFKTATVGGVQLMWFSIWLEIVWLTLWAGRILAKCLPWPIGLVSSLFTNNDKKWRDMGKQLEMPATLFFWWLAIEISFLPTVTNHVQGRGRTTFPWMVTMNKVLVSIFVGAILNFIEKIIIQLIAISFHLRTYSDRIEVNKFQIGSLTKLYKFSKDKIEMEDSEFEAPSAPSGARTPAQIVEKAQKTTKEAINKFGDVAGRIAGDFTGRQVVKSTHPHQVVLTLLSTSSGSQVLARRLYRTFYRDDTETIHSDDLKEAFDDEEEAAAAFTMFDKDMNGDISMKELEDVCVEIGRERKSITASLKDLDSVVSKLDHVFLFIVIVVTILVFISLLSTSAAGVLTSAGSTVLALSWLFSATAQEFLQSVIFVFVKHPFDVGDRVSVYGNTGALGRGDDYYVKEISLLYTEFKKLQGHVVQAPNSYLNTLFILNQRRSGGLAEAIPIVIKFGTTLEQIEQLRARLLEFVSSEAERREYQPNIITEVTEVTEVHSISVNVVFFYKSNWQNELVRLNRRNKFVCVLMVAIQDLGIEGPRMRFPGQKESYPVYLQNIPHPGSTVPGPSTMDDKQGENQPVAPPDAGNNFVNRMPSILRTGSIRPRGESLSEVARRVDFSLGMRDVKDVPYGGDVYEDRSRERERSRLAMSVQSPERRSLEQGRSSMDTGRSSALADASRPRGNSLRRVPTDASDRFSRTSHRNRFFGRGRNRDEESILEEGMPDIPESRNQSLDQRLDPRTGTVSSTAVRWDTENLHTAASGALPTTESQNRHFQRSQTEKHETEKLQ